MKFGLIIATMQEFVNYLSFVNLYYPIISYNCKLIDKLMQKQYNQFWKRTWKNSLSLEIFVQMQPAWYPGSRKAIRLKRTLNSKIAKIKQVCSATNARHAAKPSPKRLE
jgi:hypothetical protein